MQYRIGPGKVVNQQFPCDFLQFEIGDYGPGIRKQGGVQLRIDPRGLFPKAFERERVRVKQMVQHRPKPALLIGPRRPPAGGA